MHAHNMSTHFPGMHLENPMLQVCITFRENLEPHPPPPNALGSDSLYSCLPYQSVIFLSYSTQLMNRCCRQLSDVRHSGYLVRQTHFYFTHIYISESDSMCVCISESDYVCVYVCLD